MPLVTAAVLAYAAGLLTGFGGAGGWTAGAALVIAWAGARVPRDRLALAGIAIAGFAAASSTASADAACARRLLAAPEWELTLANDADPGAFVRARHACGITVRLAVRDGRAPAGARVRARGHATDGSWGVLIAGASIVQRRAPGVLPRWRAAIGRGIDNRFGSNAPLVRALLIADRADFSPTMRERFAASGLSHMLSVSGLHVGLIAAAVLLFTQLAGMSRGRAHGVIVAVTALYVLVIGVPLPALRAAAMLGVTAIAQAVQRPTSAWAVLAVSGGIALIEPRSVTDLGYQLSMVGMAALVGAGSVNRRWSAVAAMDGWRGTVCKGLVVSTIATLLTAPLVAATFGRVSLVAPVSNLAASPIIAVLQPMLFLVALLLPIPALSQFVADACVPLIHALDGVAALSARLPGASLPVVTDATTIALACAVGGAMLVAIVSRNPWPAMVAAAACLALIAWRPLVPAGATHTEIHILDVGQGDAIAVRTTRGRWLLLDAGRNWKGGDAGRRQVVPYVARAGGKVVAFVLSHPHADHVGGAASIIASLRPSWYYDPGYAGASDAYRQSLLAARESGTPWRRVRPLDSLVVDEVTVTFLAPDSVWAESLKDPNDASTVARVRVGGIAFLFTGDAEREEEGWLLAHHRPLLRADVLKVAHHGSATSSTPAFLEAVRPRLALVSVGSGNIYRHPSAEVMRSLAAHGAVALRTDRLGTIVVRTDGESLEVDAAGERWHVKP